MRVAVAARPSSLELSYKAKIFPMSNQQEFLGYLKTLGDSVSKEVRELAHELYGAEP